jgi:hypothetical protein
MESGENGLFHAVFLSNDSTILFFPAQWGHYDLENFLFLFL